MARNSIAPKVRITKYGMAASVFRHQDGGRGPTMAPPVVPVTPPPPILVIQPMAPQRRSPRR
jgi:hypothetical protein